MEKFDAKALQEFLGFEDEVVVAYGYNHDRESRVVYFKEGKLVRENPNTGEIFVVTETDFARVFLNDIKRWYIGFTTMTEQFKPGIGLPPKLVSLFESFGHDLPQIAGGTKGGIYRELEYHQS